MKCPRCGGRTEVLETLQRGEQTKRRRQCLECHHRYNTRESQDYALGELAANLPEWLKSPDVDIEALAALARVDKRRNAINAQRRALDEKERDVLCEAGFDERAEEIEREALRRELEGY